MMLRVFLFLLALIAPACAQTGTPIKQSGTVTPGHALMWTTNGVAQDAGVATNGFLTSLGVVAQGPGICQNSGAITGAFNQLCLTVSSTGGGFTFTNFAGATGAPTFTINGTAYPFPFSLTGIVGPVSSTVGDLATWNNTSGSLLKDANGSTVNGNYTWPGTNTFSGTNSTTVISGGALALTQTMSGSATLHNWNTFTTSSDTEQCAFCVDIYDSHTYGGASVRGARANIFGWSIQTTANSGSGTTVGLGVEGLAQTNSGDGGTGTGNTTAKGTYFGGNFIGANSATNVYETIGAEFDLQSTSSATGRYAFGLSAVNIESTQAAVADAGIVFYSGGRVAAAGGGGPWGPGVGFHQGIMFAELAGNGLAPIDSGGTVLGTHLESLSNIPVSYGIDLRGFSVTNCAYASTSYCVDGSGRVQVANATARSHAMDIGPDSGTNIVQINGGNSSGNGALMVLSAAGTGLAAIGFPSAQLGGSFIQNLGIFGFAGINFYTNNALTWTIDTSANLNGLSASVVTWNADTGVSRDSAGVIDVGNGTAANKSGSINATNTTLTGTATAKRVTGNTNSVPTANSCTGFALGTGSSDFAGQVSFNSATTCSISFGSSFAHAPFCTITPGSAASTTEVVTTTGGLTATFGTANTTFSYICAGS